MNKHIPESAVNQQLDQLDLVLTDLRAAIMTTDSQSLLEHSGTLQTVVNQLERCYDNYRDPGQQPNESALKRLQTLRRKLVGVGTLLQLSRAKAADLLELMLGAAQPPNTYAENGQLNLPGASGRSMKA